MNAVHITLELTGSEAHELYLITKRLTFQDVLEHTDCGQSRDERTDQAYRMVHAVAKVTDAILEAR